MAEGLREREQIRDLFGRQVGQDVARAALRNGTRLGGEEREIGALFVDLVGSTSMALRMPPTRGRRPAQPLLPVVVEVVEAEGGLVNKFEGDAALCVFGAPVASDDPAGDALRAARGARRPARARGAGARFRHRRLGRPGGGRQRRRRAALRVHGDRRPGQRGGAALRARQGARRAGARLRGGARRAPPSPSARAWDARRPRVLRGRARHARTRAPAQRRPLASGDRRA